MKRIRDKIKVTNTLQDLRKTPLIGYKPSKIQKVVIKKTIGRFREESK